MSSLTTPTASGTPSATTSSASSSVQAPANLKVIGIILAIASGLLIGTSFVFKKKGLLRSQAGHAAGEGVAYLKSPLWWLGMTMMILGELCNFAAYAFVEALVVTPLGALSVVISAILSSIFLNEKLTFFGWLGCGLCIIGSVIIALNGPQEKTVSQIVEFEKLFIAPGFLAYASTMIAISLSIVFYFGPKYGKKSMLWYITVCSTIGGISVSVTTGLGSAIVATAMGDNQFNHWFIYFLFAFVAVTLLTEVYYLNVALALFNTAMVTPTYYVIFTFCSMVTTIVLFQGLSASVSQIITVVLGFLTICVGITILQMSKVDPTQLSKLDRRSTILLQASRQNTEAEEKSIAGTEEPGIDALRGSFGTVGSIIRARTARRLSQSTRGTSSLRSRSGVLYRPAGDMEQGQWSPGHHPDPSLDGMKRHQLYDAPVPRDPEVERVSSFSSASTPQPYSPRQTTIKFGAEDLVHSYHIPGTGDDSATHERRTTVRESPSHTDIKSPSPLSYPPTGPVVAPATPTNPFSQSVPIPPRMNDEPIAPRLNTTFASTKPSDPFRSPSSPIMSAESSTTESLGGAPRWYGSDEETNNSSRHSGRGARKYPRGEDDREESMSLWRAPSIDEDEDVHQNQGGIRLVKPSSSTRF
ncbi:hypothetical protein SERLA73DRAFT_181034 [Serpula lacrymans var. lacrymans S7.3]|uniref:DUF803-domain-containing protein n=2 Tax=Serpula lacrymans var. lacrymans TaxID=341189 RepID=F8PUM8_SERL3|nr:uncharacterized protein SERLADRAFT_466907 [Serpula lacrymans var. lacrymans S7.9]EGO00436.1 hypothetical protein SERLA73DRAFT_181034 [Serpula lacrymans var. lacrymans S7.3]EGO25993.1 hypothetical protein SERLADRAFT_466907 [Serpula lacrymans var. lacrymans S7.9]